MFRNFRCYRVFSPWPASPTLLNEQLSARAFRTCSAFSERSAGWEPPIEERSESLCYETADADLIQLRTQSRVLPAAAIGEALSDRVKEFRDRTGVNPNPGERRKLKEEVRDQLLPKALLKSQRTAALFLREESVLVVDAAVPSQSEWFIDQLRPCLPRLDVRPLVFNRPAAELMRAVFMGEQHPPFQLGRECQFQDPSDRLALGTWRNVELNDPAIQRHVADGMRLIRLGLAFDNCMSFVISDDVVMNKVQFLQDEKSERHDAEDPELSFQGEVLLLTSAVKRLMGALEKCLGGYAG